MFPPPRSCAPGIGSALETTEDEATGEEILPTPNDLPATLPSHQVCSTLMVVHGTSTTHTGLLGFYTIIFHVLCIAGGSLSTVENSL